MSESVFSGDLDRFIKVEIQSLEQLEILLLLSGNPHRWWTVKGVYDVVKSNPSSVQERLEAMTTRGLLKSERGAEATFRFDPENPAVWSTVTELRDAYKERSVKVVEAIYARPADAVEEFARAFRIRKEK